MANKPTLKIIYDANDMPVAASCSCGHPIPEGIPRITDAQKSERWFRQGFEIHVWEKHSNVHLISDGKLKRCSICGYPFQPDVKPSMSVAFAEHLLKAHQPGQTTEDVNQAAARIVRETTES